MKSRKINLDKLSKRISEEIRKEENKESLTNRQKKSLDKNNNNRIDPEDFKILRKQKSEKNAAYNSLILLGDIKEESDNESDYYGELTDNELDSDSDYYE